MSEWRTVPWASKYEVSDTGQVRNRKSRKLRSTYLNNNTYPSVTILLDNGRETQQHIHRLVCGAFHGPPPDSKPVVRHLNGNPNDNRPENLAWGTHLENNLDCVRHGRNANANKSACAKGHPFTPENTYVRVTGSNEHRQCRTCNRERNHRWRNGRQAS